MKKAIIYVRNKTIRPSDYYRMTQYAKDLNANVIIRSAIPDKLDRWSLDNKNNIVVKILSQVLCYFCIVINFIKGYFKDKKEKPDCIIVIREIFPRKILPMFKGMLNKKCKMFNFIWDFDDSIIGGEISNAEADIYINCAKKIVVSTPYLKECLSAQTQKKTEVLCTTDGDLSNIDIDKINESRLKNYETTINVIWVATASNLPNLINVSDYFDEAAKIIREKLNKQLVLKVVCNKGLETKYDNLKVDNIVWTHDGALKEIMSAHIGIMPLIQNEFALGKAGFKLIQYMSGGLPLIASNVGYNSSIIDADVGFSVEQNSKEQWVDAIVALASDKNTWSEYSKNSHQKWHSEYSYDTHLDFWQKLIDNN